MLNVNPFEEHVAARLLDFFHSKTPWQRGLWTPGVLLTIREVLQASEAAAAGVISLPSLHNVASSAIELVGRDPAFGDKAAKKLLHAALRTDARSGGIVFRSVDARVVEKLATDLSRNYLRTWATCLRAGPAGLGAERTARAIASHLLDSDFSSDYLHRWWTYKIRHEPGDRSLAALLEDAQHLLSQPLKTFELVVAFEKAPIPTAAPAKSPWISNQEVSKWLRANKFEVRDLRAKGGVRLTIIARDVFLATEKAAEAIDRLVTRISLGTYKEICPFPKVWIAGEPAPLPMRSARPRIEMHALSRENQLYVDSHSGRIDAGMELAAALNSDSPSTAIAGGWAAVESLMTGPGDDERVYAADRLATIAACSFPRAELTALSYSLEASGGAIADQLRACPTNKDRAAVLVQLIKNAKPPTFTSSSDKAALGRVTKLINSPHTVLNDVKSHLSLAFRRLYRHRNLVLHWGKTDAVGIRSCWRASAPLVGAGLDRIAHAWFTEACDPLELAARASIRLGTVDTELTPSVLDLLES